MNYVMIPSDIAFFVLGIIATLVVETFFLIRLGKKEEKKKQEFADKFTKMLVDDLNKKDKK